MSFDLSRALHEAADRATGAREPLPAAPVLGRIRRRRTIRTTTASAVGAAAVGAVVLGGLQLAGHDDPPPPATTPTPSVTGSTVACGTVMAEVPRLDVTGLEARSALLLPDDVDEAIGEYAVGAPVPVSTTVRRPGGPDADGLETQLTLVAAADGVVVGVVDPDGSAVGPPATEEIAGPDGPVEVTQEWHSSLVACGSDGPRSTPLEAGSYTLYGVVTVLDDGSGTAVPGALLTGPHPITLLAQATSALPVCGGETSTLAATPGPVVGTTSLQVGVTDAGTGEFLPEGYGDVVQVALALVNDSDAARSLQREGIRAVLARDGVVVAEAELGRGSGTADDVDAGGLVRVSGSLRAESCTDGEYLGAGDYTLWAASEVTVDGEGTTTVVHEPVPFTIFELEDPDNPGPGPWTAGGFVPGDGERDAEAPTAGGVEDLVLGLDGLDGLPLGARFAGTTSPSPHVVWDPVRCAGTESPGSWRAAYPDVEGLNGMPTPPFDVLVMEERLRAIVVKGPGPRTTEGIGLGSTLAEVRTAYDVRPGEDDGLDVEEWVVQEDGSTLLFEIARDYPDGTPSWSAEQKGTVVGMAVMADGYRVQPRGWEYCG